MGEIGERVTEVFAKLKLMTMLGICRIVWQLFCMVTVTIGVGAVLGLLSWKFSIFMIIVSICYLGKLLWDIL